MRENYGAVALGVDSAVRRKHMAFESVLKPLVYAQHESRTTAETAMFLVEGRAEPNRAGLASR